MARGKNRPNRSVMKHQFSQIPKANIPRSSFDRSCGHKTTFDAGYLIPIYCDEALPGDTHNVRLTAFARMSTPLHPVMDNLFMETFFFAVPNRLIWQNWKRFNGEQDNPGDSTDFLVPQMAAGITFGEGTIYDYLGFATDVNGLQPSGFGVVRIILFIMSGFVIRICRILFLFLRVMVRMLLVIIRCCVVVRDMIILLRRCLGHRKVIPLICRLV